MILALSRSERGGFMRARDRLFNIISAVQSSDNAQITALTRRYITELIKNVVKTMTYVA